MEYITWQGALIIAALHLLAYGVYLIIAGDEMDRKREYERIAYNRAYDICLLEGIDYDEADDMVGDAWDEASDMIWDALHAPDLKASRPYDEISELVGVAFRYMKPPKGYEMDNDGGEYLVLWKEEE